MLESQHNSVSRTQVRRGSYVGLDADGTFLRRMQQSECRHGTCILHMLYLIHCGAESLLVLFVGCLGDKRF
jgi:hypothetical protein